MYSDQTKNILNKILSFIFGCLIILFINSMVTKPITVFIKSNNHHHNRNDKNLYRQKCWNCK